MTPEEIDAQIRALKDRKRALLVRRTIYLPVKLHNRLAKMKENGTIKSANAFIVDVIERVLP